jgi:hypothetical protein
MTRTETLQREVQGMLQEQSGTIDRSRPTSVLISLRLNQEGSVRKGSISLEMERAYGS